MLISLYLILSLFCSQPEAPHVVLITIDGVRWQEIYNGTDSSRDGGHHLTPEQLVPNLYDSFVKQGIAIGKDSSIITSGPNHVSLPGYLEMVRGHQSLDCQNNFCSNPIIDQGIFWFFKNPVVFSSWPGIIKTIPINSNHITYNIPSTYRSDNLTILSSLYYLNNNHLDFLWVSLGDTDEYGHQDNYYQYIKSLQVADSFIGLLVNKYPNATFIITTDHGRSLNFRDHGSDKASERVWLMMRGPSIPKLGSIKIESISLSNILYTIADIEFNSHSSNSILSKIK